MSDIETDFRPNAKLLLLTKFLRANSFDRYIQDPYWEFALKDKPINILADFVSKGLLGPGSIKDKVNYCYLIVDLKQELRKRNKKLSGNKPELIDRLLNSKQSLHNPKLDDCEVYICSSVGQAVAEKYKTEKQADLQNLEKKVISYLRNRDFDKAIRTVRLRNEEQEFYGTIYGGFWDEHKSNRLTTCLNIIFHEIPKILDGFSESEIEILRIRAGLLLVLGRNKLTKKHVPRELLFESNLDINAASRMFVFYAYSKTTLDRYRKSGIKEVEISTCLDSCNNCKEINRRKYKIEDAIELPYHLCSHKYGCRCTYLPITSWHC